MSTPFVGEIRLFGFSRIPQGWKACDGSLLSIAQYDVLFTLLGTTYGGDGQTSFALPDLRGRVPVHQGAGPGLSPRVMGQAGGTEQVTLISPQLPAHTHTLQVTASSASATVPASTLQLGALSDDAMYLADLSSAAPIQLSAASIEASGGNQPHDNLMPTQTVSYCMAWAGIYPSHN